MIQGYWEITFGTWKQEPHICEEARICMCPSKTASSHTTKFKATQQNWLKGLNPSLKRYAYHYTISSKGWYKSSAFCRKLCPTLSKGIRNLSNQLAIETKIIEIEYTFRFIHEKKCCSCSSSVHLCIEEYKYRQKYDNKINFVSLGFKSFPIYKALIQWLNFSHIIDQPLGQHYSKRSHGLLTVLWNNVEDYWRIVVCPKEQQIQPVNQMSWEGKWVLFRC